MCECARARVWSAAVAALIRSSVARVSFSQSHIASTQPAICRRAQRLPYPPPPSSRTHARKLTTCRKSAHTRTQTYTRTHTRADTTKNSSARSAPRIPGQRQRLRASASACARQCNLCQTDILLPHSAHPGVCQRFARSTRPETADTIIARTMRVRLLDVRRSVGA